MYNIYNRDKIQSESAYCSVCYLHFQNSITQFCNLYFRRMCCKTEIVFLKFIFNINWNGSTCLLLIVMELLRVFISHSQYIFCIVFRLKRLAFISQTIQRVTPWYTPGSSGSESQNRDKIPAFRHIGALWSRIGLVTVTGQVSAPQQVNRQQ